MHSTESLDELRAAGKMRWIGSADAWLAEADDVMRALARDGFEECKHEEARDPRHHARNGVWQGLNAETGSVASVIWIRRGLASDATVFIDIDGNPLVGE